MEAGGGGGGPCLAAYLDASHAIREKPDWEKQVRVGLCGRERARERASEREREREWERRRGREGRREREARPGRSGCERVRARDGGLPARVSARPRAMRGKPQLAKQARDIKRVGVRGSGRWVQESGPTGASGVHAPCGLAAASWLFPVDRCSLGL